MLYEPRFKGTCEFYFGIFLYGIYFIIPVEHILSLLSAIAASTACDTEDLTYERFVKYFYPWVFNFLPYSLILGAMTQVWNNITRNKS